MDRLTWVANIAVVALVIALSNVSWSKPFTFGVSLLSHKDDLYVVWRTEELGGKLKFIDTPGEACDRAGFGTINSGLIGLLCIKSVVDHVEEAPHMRLKGWAID